MQEMSKRFRPIFPRVRGGVLAYETPPIVPIVGSRMVRLEKSLIALTLVAKDETKWVVKLCLVD
jgi:hypothetical protein